MNSLKNPLLFLALDSLIKDEEKTLKTVKGFREIEGNFGCKINLDYLLRKGLSQAVQIIRSTVPGKPIFCDTKTWNGKRTMVDLAKQMIDLEVDYFNIYALADQEIDPVVKVLEGSKTKLLVVTVLTHYNDEYCRRHFGRSFAETVRHFSEIAALRKAHGIILPGNHLQQVADLNLEKCTPGIRPDWFKDDRHSEEVTPEMALAGGSNLWVCGSPIFKSENPVEALKKILASMVSTTTD